MRSRALTTGFTPLVAKTVNGKLWFLPLDGVSVIDPRHLPFNKLPPPVQIERVAADRKTYWQNLFRRSIILSSRGCPLWSAILRTFSDFRARACAAPEKVLFRYKLEGWDRDWQDA